MKASRLFSPMIFGAALVLSSCVGAIVQTTLLPKDSGRAIASSPPTKRQALYVQSTSLCCYYNGSYAPIPGMSLVLPAATIGLHNALVTFNAPTVTASTNGVCELAIFNGSSAIATMESGPSTGVEPSYLTANIVVQVPLTSASQTVTVDEANYCTLTQFYSFSALLTV